jgi:mannose-6-phosphate isomerase-like protein (cupin superfamily)
MLRPVRRIVTANDANGKSGVMIDDVAKNTITVLTELWITEAGKHNHLDGIDHASRSTQLEPPKGGTLFRYFEIMPESDYAHLSEAEKQQAAADWFAAMKGAHLRPDTSKHPAMHKSTTTDYIILLKGEITLVLDKEERTLQPLDCVVQRGTNHAWVNRGKEPALLMAVLVDDGTHG